MAISGITAKGGYAIRDIVNHILAGRVAGKRVRPVVRVLSPRVAARIEPIRSRATSAVPKFQISVRRKWQRAINAITHIMHSIEVHTNVRILDTFRPLRFQGGTVSGLHQLRAVATNWSGNGAKARIVARDAIAVLCIGV